jgi:hypothetical protein
MSIEWITLNRADYGMTTLRVYRDIKKIQKSNHHRRKEREREKGMIKRREIMMWSIYGEKKSLSLKTDEASKSLGPLHNSTAATGLLRCIGVFSLVDLESVSIRKP